jgi:hypothetical protein
MITPSPTLDAIITCTIFVALAAAVIFTIIFLALCLAKWSIRHNTEKLRCKGILPPRETATDEDIIRLANEGRREEAAYLYTDLHQTSLERSRIIVGQGTTSMWSLCVLWAFTLVVLANALFDAHWDPLNLPLSAFFFLFLAIYAHKHRHALLRNRQTLAGGQLPPSDAWNLCAKRSN